MKSRLYMGVVVHFLALYFIGNARGQHPEVRYPYYVDFTTGSRPPAVVLAPGTNSAAFTADGLRLTDSLDQFGGVLLDGTSFNSTNGIEIEFEYAMYGGVIHSGKYGDGLTVFLHDADVPLNIGASGASLGYSYRRAVAAQDRLAGLNGAYLGIGFDVFGNFKSRRFEAIERMGGISASWGEYSNHITLRGAMHPGGLGSSAYGARGKQYSGYPVLISRTTKAVASGVAGRELNTADGSFRSLPSIPLSDTFSIRSGVRSFTSGSAGYRKAFVTLVPHADGGMVVTVRVQHGPATTTVIDRFHYPVSLTYVENANADAMSVRNPGNESAAAGANDTIRMNTPVPDRFKIGFAAGTGAASQVHLIRNFEVRIPYMPRVGQDDAALCVNYVSGTVIKPFENDLVYNGSLSGTPRQGNTADFIDYRSFHFELADGSLTPQPYAYTQEGKGTWNYSTQTGVVTFVPAPGYTGDAELYYSVKGLNTNGGPFGQDIYRSGPAKMKVSVRRCNTVSNPALPSGQGIK